VAYLYSVISYSRDRNAAQLGHDRGRGAIGGRARDQRHGAPQIVQTNARRRLGVTAACGRLFGVDQRDRVGVGGAAQRLELRARGGRGSLHAAQARQLRLEGGAQLGQRAREDRQVRLFVVESSESRLQRNRKDAA